MPPTVHYGCTVASMRARYPELMRLGDPPTIIGHRCRSCGRRAFPPDPYGCEQCGAARDELDEIELAPTGTIHAVATVHRHHRPKPETPFSVATIVLDDGIALKAVLTGDLAPARVGARVRAVTVPWDTDQDGAHVLDLRFEVTEPGPAGSG